MAFKGQTVEEIIEALSTIAGHGIVFTNYKMSGFTSDGAELTVIYNGKDDNRLK